MEKIVLIVHRDENADWLSAFVVVMKKGIVGNVGRASCGWKVGVVVDGPWVLCKMECGS